MSERLKQLFDEAIAINQEARGHLQHTLDLYKSAVNELNAKRAECERLRKALERIASEECYEACSYTLPERTKWFRAIAAAALSPKESPNG